MKMINSYLNKKSLFKHNKLNQSQNQQFKMSNTQLMELSNNLQIFRAVKTLLVNRLNKLNVHAVQDHQKLVVNLNVKWWGIVLHVACDRFKINIRKLNILNISHIKFHASKVFIFLFFNYLIAFKLIKNRIYFIFEK